MSYADLNFDFGQFDRDNMNRFLVATYINQANSVLAMIYASPRAGQAAARLIAGRRGSRGRRVEGARQGLSGRGRLGQDGIHERDGRGGASRRARRAAELHRGLQGKGRSPKFIDTVNYQRSQP